ncbi:hypothetical protein ISCGN_024522 [Ixodes scapularis]
MSRHHPEPHLESNHAGKTGSTWRGNAAPQQQHWARARAKRITSEGRCMVGGTRTCGFIQAAVAESAEGGVQSMTITLIVIGRTKKNKCRSISVMPPASV